MPSEQEGTATLHLIHLNGYYSPNSLSLQIPARPSLSTSHNGMELDQGIPPEPEEFEALYDSRSTIWIYRCVCMIDSPLLSIDADHATTHSGSDSDFQLRHKLSLEFDDTPLTNPMLALDVNGQQDLTHNITLIYITEFFTDCADFAFYVKGLKNMTEFSKGTFSKKAYDGPCFATPVLGFNLTEIFEKTGQSYVFDLVSRTETKGLRWR